MKLPTLGVTVRPSLSSLGREPRQPLVVVRDRRLLVGAVLDRRDAGRDRRRRDVERTADAVQHVGDRRPGNRPSRGAAPRGRGSSRTCASSPRCRRGRDQFEAGLVVVAAHVLAVGGVEHQQRRWSAGRRAGGALRRTECRCRSDCSGLARNTILVRGVTRCEDRVDVGASGSFSGATTGVRAARRAWRSCRRGSRASVKIASSPGPR